MALIILWIKGQWIVYVLQVKKIEFHTENKNEKQELYIRILYYH